VAIWYARPDARCVCMSLLSVSRPLLRMIQDSFEWKLSLPGLFGLPASTPGVCVCLFCMCRPSAVSGVSQGSFESKWRVM